MKRLVLLITLASLAALPLGGAAATRARECPRVFVSCPDSVRAGEPATFTASIDNAPANAKLTYNWDVSAGTVTSGQGTSSVTVDTTGVTGLTTATVEVGGLPESCPKSTACTSAVQQFIFHDKVDEYGNIKFEDEKARLDNYAIELQNDPEFVGYIVGYGGRRSRRGEASRRTERAKRYVVTVRGIDASRLLTIDGGYREELTVELKIRHKTLPPPEPFPTVDPSEVKFIKPAPKRKPRRR
jgi:hypothetical protein